MPIENIHIFTSINRHSKKCKCIYFKTDICYNFLNLSMLVPVMCFTLLMCSNLDVQMWVPRMLHCSKLDTSRAAYLSTPDVMRKSMNYWLCFAKKCVHYACAQIFNQYVLNNKWSVVYALFCSPTKRFPKNCMQPYTHLLSTYLYVESQSTLCLCEQAHKFE